MKKKRLIVGLAILVVICVLAVFLDPTYVLLGLLRNESFYQRRPTTYWSREIQKLRPRTSSAGFFVYLDKFFDYFRSSEPIKKEDLTLLKGGPEAAPVLKELLRDKEPFVRWNAAFTLLDAGDVQPREVVPALCDALLYQDDYRTRYEAAEIMEEIGPEPETEIAIPALILALNDDGFFIGSNGDFVRSKAARILSRIGAPAVPALTKGLRDPDVAVRREAASVGRRQHLALGRHDDQVVEILEIRPQRRETGPEARAALGLERAERQPEAALLHFGQQAADRGLRHAAPDQVADRDAGYLGVEGRLPRHEALPQQPEAGQQDQRADQRD